MCNVCRAHQAVLSTKERGYYTVFWHPTVAAPPDFFDVILGNRDPACAISVDGLPTDWRTLDVRVVVDAAGSLAGRLSVRRGNDDPWSDWLDVSDVTSALDTLGAGRHWNGLPSDHPLKTGGDLGEWFSSRWEREVSELPDDDRGVAAFAALSGIAQGRGLAK